MNIKDCIEEDDHGDDDDDDNDDDGDGDYGDDDDDDDDIYGSIALTNNIKVAHLIFYHYFMYLVYHINVSNIIIVIMVCNNRQSQCCN